MKYCMSDMRLGNLQAEIIVGKERSENEIIYTDGTLLRQWIFLFFISSFLYAA